MAPSGSLEGTYTSCFTVTSHCPNKNTPRQNSLHMDNQTTSNNISQNNTFSGASLLKDTKNSNKIQSTTLLNLGKGPRIYPKSPISNIPRPSETTINTISPSNIHKPIKPSIDTKNAQTSKKNSKPSHSQEKLPYTTYNEFVEPKCNPYLPPICSSLPSPGTVGGFHSNILNVGSPFEPKSDVVGGEGPTGSSPCDAYVYGRKGSNVHHQHAGATGSLSFRGDRRAIELYNSHICVTPREYNLGTTRSLQSQGTIS